MKEVLRKIKEANEILEKYCVKEIRIGTVDLVALYPSIDQREGPRLVSKEVRKSSMNYENINYHLAAVYLGSTMTIERQIKEGMRKLILQRKVKTY